MFYYFLVLEIEKKIVCAITFKFSIVEDKSYVFITVI